MAAACPGCRREARAAVAGASQPPGRARLAARCSLLGRYRVRPATGRVLPAPCGERSILRSRGGGSMTPRPRCKKPVQCSGRRVASAGSRTPSAGSPTSLCSVAMCSRCGLGLVMRATTMPRGVADLEDQLRGVAKER